MLDGMPHEQFNELFKKLPENLQDAIYAEETGQNAEAICERNKIPELFGFLIDRILSVYLGILPLEKFPVGVRSRGSFLRVARAVPMRNARSIWESPTFSLSPSQPIYFSPRRVKCWNDIPLPKARAVSPVRSRKWVFRKSCKSSGTAGRRVA